MNNLKDVLPLDKLRKLGYSILVRGYTVLLEPKNLTKQTAGLLRFKKKDLNVHEELDEMYEERGLGR